MSVKYRWGSALIVVEREFQYIVPKRLDVWGYIKIGKGRFSFVMNEDNVYVSYPKSMPKGLKSALKKLYDKRMKVYE